MSFWKKKLLFSFLFIPIIIIIIPREVSCVTVHEVKFLTNSGKDYVQVGEEIIFSCLFMLDPGEVIQSVVWEKDQEPVYSWMKEVQEPPRPLGMLEGNVDLTNESPSTLVVKNATIEMQGTYSCHVTSQKSKSQNEIILIVIKDGCDESSWETHSDMVSCIEDIRFYCRGMFPKPSPVCGIYNDDTGSFIQSVSFDRVEKMEDGTYEVSLFRRWYAKDWREKYQDTKLSFRCFVIVVSTTWRKGIHHRLFGESGCPLIPLGGKNLTRGHYNISFTGNTCWGNAKEGSRLSYTCDPGTELLGPEELICKNSTWKPIPTFDYHLDHDQDKDQDQDDYKINKHQDNKDEDDEHENDVYNMNNDDYDDVITNQKSSSLFPSRSLSAPRSLSRGFNAQAKKFTASNFKNYIPKGPVMTVCSSSSSRSQVCSRTFLFLLFLLSLIKSDIL